MSTIIAGMDSTVTVTVQLDGSPLPISGVVMASVYNKTGATQLIAPAAVDDAATGADWPAGVVVVGLLAADTADLPVGDVMLVLTGAFGIKRFKMVVETLLLPTRTSLFIKDIVIDEMRTDRLVAASAGALANVSVSDDYIWQKVRAAESEIAHSLRVPLVPTRFFPTQPTQEKIDALDGLAWAVESSPDYEPGMFEGSKWGYIITRQIPIISVEDVRFVYPSYETGSFQIPTKWISLDKKYGHVRIVPTANVAAASVAGFMVLGTTGFRTIPSMVRIEYTAGLEDVEVNYPELLDAIKKTAVIKIIEDAFLPQSGSISADGLSQSLSIDIGKYRDDIDVILNGKNGNGGLMASIHGIRGIIA